MASLATFRNVMARHVIQPRMPPQSAEEFGAFHLSIVGHKCPIVNEGNRVSASGCSLDPMLSRDLGWLQFGLLTRIDKAANFLRPINMPYPGGLR